ncbi:DUF2790 domain-containing protein [Pseudomonas tolaasii]|uniref:DUF2790 domain-containing protein n=2 Tax=Pseudomonas tolaasii TaxID=29442 RepID=A0A7Y8ANN0_PSETO|nr:DUF2790 domain-containing protein [Pseudomonas tolaasii]ARB29397.1 hypothetical protein B5P22_19515 [Pseudomonas tolaasii]KAB0478046.1 DUF2790 domain-containing protein [Pseudomonas tolaasii]MBW1246810.1 DUF2790 domain-containing protein [Pseudomonas tolaasii]MBW4793665.1 DUF2790 domain-containing protein [Pseudomonas tolaasii]MBY8940508.1 DUF2790 domain-containing protein [Pseudomonas tolaasii]
MKILFALPLALVVSHAFAAPAPEPARTGVPLDVARTISVTDTSQACGVVPVEWVYDDSQGVRHIATYLVMGGGCNS